MTRNIQVYFIGMLVLSACSEPNYSNSTINSEIIELSAVAPELLSNTKLAKSLSGDFENDLAEVVKGSSEYIAALNNLATKESQIVVAEADRKFQVSAKANAGQITKDGAGSPSNTERGASVDLSISQLIFDGGASAAEIDQAQANAFIAEMEVELVANNIAKDAAISWIDLNTLLRRGALLEALIAKTEKMVAQMETLVASGMIDKSASASAEIAARALSMEKTNLDAQMAAATASYVSFFGSMPKNLSSPSTLLTTADLLHIQSNWNHAPVLAQASARVLAAKQVLIAAKGREQPKVGVRAGMTSPMERNERTNYAVGVEISWIISDGGRRKANTVAQAANLEAAEQRLKGAKRSGKRDLDTAASRRSSLIAALENLAAQGIASQNELEIMWSQLATGQTSVRQLIQAEEKVYRISDLKMSTASDLLKIDFEILASTGLLAKRLGIKKNNSVTRAAK